MQDYAIKVYEELASKYYEIKKESPYIDICLLAEETVKKKYPGFHYRNR